MICAKIFGSISTEGSKKKWVESEVASYCENGNLTFQEAFQFASSKDSGSSKTGQRAVKILWDEFGSNCKLSLKKKNAGKNRRREGFRISGISDAWGENINNGIARCCR